MSEAPTRRTRVGAVAGLLGAATAFMLIVGAGPAPSVFEMIGVNEDISGNCDEAEHANDPECAGTPTSGGTGSTSNTGSTSTTVDGSTTTAASGSTDPATDVRAIDAAGAGTVLVAVEGSSLRLVAATPASGWRVEVEQAAGREIKVDFHSGTRRVQVSVELEDGQVRERVRVRDDVDNSGSGSGSDDATNDNSNSGPGSGSSDDDSGHDSDD